MKLTMTALAAIWLSVTPAWAFPAIVYSCHDGDTCSILSEGHLIKLRFAGIDAPEMAVPGKWSDQPGAYEAHAALDDMIMGQTVDVEDTGQRSYKRMVARIIIMADGKPVDVNEAMVAQGWAWSAAQFEPVHDRDPAMPGLEAQARAAHLGLWAEPMPSPPWVWRHRGVR